MRFGGRSLTIGVLLLTSAIATTESPLYFGPTQPVDAGLFGMHIHRAASGTEWPAVALRRVAAVGRARRVAATGTRAGQVEFRVARSVRAACQRTARRNPADPRLDSGMGIGAAARTLCLRRWQCGRAAATLSDWEEYVRVVATRYKGVIHNYEIWNEPNVKGTFTGDPQAMLELSRSCISSLEVRRSHHYRRLACRPQQKTGFRGSINSCRRGGCQYADVIGYHFYVTPKAPEAMLALIARVRRFHAKTCLRE